MIVSLAKEEKTEATGPGLSPGPLNGKDAP